MLKRLQIGGLEMYLCGVQLFLIHLKFVVMKKVILYSLLVLFSMAVRGQNATRTQEEARKIQIEDAVIQQFQQVEPYFREAYHLYPTLPRGVLETVAFTYTRFHHLSPDPSADTTEEIPYTYGIMGLTLNGKGYFRENLQLVSQLSGYTIEQIIRSPRDNVVAYAAAYATLQQRLGIFSQNIADHFPILDSLSELPVPTSRNLQFAVQSQHYAYCLFVNHERYRNALGMQLPKVNVRQVFGEDFSTLHSGIIKTTDNQEDNIKISQGDRTATDYANARWAAAGSCNYSSRSGHEISAITIHYTQGTYAGSIAWFQNCTYNGVGSRVSAHYVLRSIDGQVTQMVRERDKAWHVGNSNAYTIGLEHEAYGDIASFFTPEMYQSSALLTRDICERNGIPPYRMFYRDTLDNGTVLNYGLHSLGSETACTKIRGHQHFPEQTHTDPGPFWDWNYYFKLVNYDTPATEYHTATGVFTDSGGVDGDYGNDERTITVIQVPNAETITLTFSEFALEENYDFMWIYDGPSVFSPLIGRWNTMSPGSVTSTGDALTIEFRSDCATTAAGWKASWRANLPTLDQSPTTAIVHDDDEWETEDFYLDFDDDDDHGIAYRFYQLMGNDGHRWTANPNRGFACDNFDDFNTGIWNPQCGNWSILDHQLTQSGTSPAKISMPLQQNLSAVHLLDFYAAIDNWEDTSRIEITFGADRSEIRNGGVGYSVGILPSARRLEICRWVNGDVVVFDSLENISTNRGMLYRYRIIHNRENGEVFVYRGNQQLMHWQDPVPLAIAGSHVAVTTLGMNVRIDNWRVYRSRDERVRVKVGSGLDDDAIWQASNGTARTKAKSIVMDDSGQFSSLVEKSIRIDFTAPRMRGIVTDGNAQDISILRSGVVSAHWSEAEDPHSNIDHYEYFICTAGNSTTQIETGRVQDTSFMKKCELRPGNNYFIKVRAVNHAGLASRFIQSNGFAYQPIYVGNTLPLTKSIVSPAASIFPNPFRDHFTIQITEETDDAAIVHIYDTYGKLIARQELIGRRATIDTQDWASGMYFLHTYINGKKISIEKIIKD